MKLLNNSIINSILYPAINLSRLYLVGHLFGKDFFTSMYLDLLLIGFFVAALNYSYDSASVKDKNILHSINNLIQMIILTLMVFALILNNHHYFIILFIVLDSIIFLNSRSNSVKKNLLIHLIRIISTIFLINFNYLLIFITSFFTVLINYKKIIINDLPYVLSIIRSFPLILFSHGKNYFEKNVISLLLTSDLFFISIFIEKLFNGIGSITYHFIRNLTSFKYFEIAKKVIYPQILFFMICILYIQNIHNSPNNYILLIFIYFLIFTCESIIAQIFLLFSKNVNYFLFRVNLFSCLLMLSIYLAIKFTFFTNFSFEYFFVIASISSICITGFLLKSFRLRFED